MASSNVLTPGSTSLEKSRGRKAIAKSVVASGAASLPLLALLYSTTSHVGLDATGVVGLALAVTAPLNLVFGLQFNPLLASTPRDEHVFTALLRLRVLLTLTAAVLSLPLTLLFDIEGLLVACMFLGLYRAAESTGTLVHSNWHRFDQQTRLLRARVVSSSIIAAIVVLTGSTTESLHWILAALVAGRCAVALSEVLLSREHIDLSRKFVPDDFLKPKELVPLAALAGTLAVATNMARYLAGTSLTAEDIGIITLASYPLTLGLMVSGSINMIYARRRKIDVNSVQILNRAESVRIRLRLARPNFLTGAALVAITAIAAVIYTRYFQTDESSPLAGTAILFSLSSPLLFLSRALVSINISSAVAFARATAIAGEALIIAVTFLLLVAPLGIYAFPCSQIVGIMVGIVLLLATKTDRQTD